MGTALFLIFFGAIAVGFVLWKTVMQGGRKNQGSRAEIRAQRQEPKAGRGSGRGDD